MRTRTLAVVLAAAGAVALTACSGTPSSVETNTSKAASEAPGKNAADSKSAGQLVGSGFGQSDEYVWVTSLVKNTASTVGQTVTVQFNVYDKADKLVGSTEQVESFRSVGQLLAVGTQLDLEPGVKAARVKATLQVKDDGTFSSDPFPLIKTSAVKIGKDEFGGVSGTFDVINPTDKPLENSRIGVICYNAKKEIIGGSSEFPDLVPPADKYHVTSTLNVSGTPDSCTAYAGPDIA